MKTDNEISDFEQGFRCALNWMHEQATEMELEVNGRGCDVVSICWRIKDALTGHLYYENNSGTLVSQNIAKEKGIPYLCLLDKECYPLEVIRDSDIEENSEEEYDGYPGSDDFDITSRGIL